MITVTVQQQKAIDAGRFKHFVRFTIDQNTTLTIGEDEIWDDGFKIDQAVSGRSAFELGACVINQLTLEIYNPSGKYQNTDFIDKPTYAYINLYDEDDEVIGTISKGYYTVDEADTNGSILKLTCLDGMALLDRPYSDVSTAYPATLYQIVSGIATTCGLTLSLDGDTWLPSGITSAYTVTDKPTDDVTCRDILSYVCQATGNYATINMLGQLLITRYDDDFISEDGSDFSDYTYHDITPASMFKFSRDEAQVTLTGVSIETDGTTYTAGSDGYMIYIKDNPVINAGSEQTFATALNTLVNGWNFRPFKATYLYNMLMEVADNVLLTDTLGNIYKSIVMHMEYAPRRSLDIECAAEAAAVNSSVRYSPAAKAASNAVKNYDVTVNNYIDLVNKAYGMYRSLITDPDDSSSQIYAFHNESTYGNSTFCMFENGNGIQVGRRDTSSDPWVFTSASVSDAVALVQLLTANTAIINQLFAQDITVGGQLHSSDYVAGTGSPPYSQAGMGLDFANKQYQAENFAVDENGNVYAKAGQIAGWNVGGYNLVSPDYYYSDGSYRYYKRVRLITPLYESTTPGQDVIVVEACTVGEADDATPSLYVPTFSVNTKGEVVLNRAYSDGSPSTFGTADYDNNYFAIGGASTTPSFRAKRLDSTGDVVLGVGATGVNHGLYSVTLGKWMIYADNSSIYVNGYAAEHTINAGDSVTIGLSEFAGCWISNNTCRWFIPLSKVINPDVSSVTISAGTWVIRGINGAITVNGNTTSWTKSNSSSVTCDIRENGVYIVSVATTNTTGQNDTPVVVQTNSAFVLTFS